MGISATVTFSHRHCASHTIQSAFGRFVHNSVRENSPEHREWLQEFPLNLNLFMQLGPGQQLVSYFSYFSQGYCSTWATLDHATPVRGPNKNKSCQVFKGWELNETFFQLSVTIDSKGQMKTSRPRVWCIISLSHINFWTWAQMSRRWFSKWACNACNFCMETNMASC